MHREKAYFSTKNLKSTIFCVMSNNPMKQRFALEVGCQVNKKKAGSMLLTQLIGLFGLGATN
jgi:hypothetical protein